MLETYLISQANNDQNDFRLQSKAELKAWLRRLGLIGDVYSGIQVDVNVAAKKISKDTYKDGSLCDHNCTQFVNGISTGGQYSCPAAITANKGLKPQSFAPIEIMLEGIKHTVEGIKKTRSFFLSKVFFQTYNSNFNLPSYIEVAIKELLEEGKIEVNLFGGNPEMHRGIATLIQELKNQDMVVNFTTTGRRFISDKTFLQEIKKSRPDMIALSADDFESGKQIKRLANMSLKELEQEWKKISWQHGQRQKAYEAIYVAKLAQEEKEFPNLLFNLVIHPANILHIWEIIEALLEAFPSVRVNPFPAQTAFMYSTPTFVEQQQIQALESFCDQMMAIQLVQGKGAPVQFAPRLHYWFMLKSVFNTVRGDLTKISELISGYGIWQCYKAPGAGRYVQISGSPKAWVEGKVPGGHLGCFWNSETVTNADLQVWSQEPIDISDHILNNMKSLARSAKKPCPGCAFPRLNFDIISLETGLSSDLRPAYLALRKLYLGF